jgi:hypothetical protein
VRKNAKRKPGFNKDGSPDKRFKGERKIKTRKLIAKLSDQGKFPSENTEEGKVLRALVETVKERGVDEDCILPRAKDIKNIHDLDKELDQIIFRLEEFSDKIKCCVNLLRVN